VKLSSRSAKDALPNQVRTLYEKYAKEDKIQETDYNGRLIAIIKAAFDVLQVYDEKTALHMLLTSERIYSDLELALQHPELFKQSVVIRQWVRIEVDMEWRGYVYDGKLNALSQYNYVPYFERLVKLQDTIKERISSFFYAHVQEKLAKINFKNYVIDFAVTGERFDKVYVIEINPWGPETDSALFSFKTEELEILRKQPLTIRVRTEPHSKVKETFESCAANFLSDK